MALAAALFVAGAVLIARRLRGRARTAPAFAWAATLFVLLLPVAQPWYWLTPLALGIAGGVLLPLWLGLAAPFGYAAFAYPSFKRWAALVTYLPLLTLVPGLRAGSTARRGLQSRATRAVGDDELAPVRHTAARGGDRSRWSILRPDRGSGRTQPRRRRRRASTGPRAGEDPARRIARRTARLRDLRHPAARDDGLARAISTAATCFLALAPGRDGEHVLAPPGRRSLDLGLPSGDGSGWTLLSQRGAHLGERLGNLFEDLFARGHEQAVIVNSDSPGVPVEYLETTRRWMSESNGETATGTPVSSSARRPTAASTSSPRRARHGCATGAPSRRPWPRGRWAPVRRSSGVVECARARRPALAAAAVLGRRRRRERPRPGRPAAPPDRVGAAGPPAGRAAGRAA